MSRRTTRVASALLATLFAGLAMTALAARAEPSATPASTDNCLAKPNAPAPAGSHWYYRLEHASGRRCWHLRAQGGSADVKIDQGEHAATRSLAAPAGQPSTETPPDSPALSGDNAQRAAAPVAPTPSAPADWPSATASGQLMAPVNTNAAPITNDNAAEQAPAPPAIDPRADAGAADSNSGSAPPISAPAPSTERWVASAVDPAHIPALLGTALVLAFIILGSFAGHLASRFLRRRRQQSRALPDVPSPSWDEPYSDAQAADIASVPAATPRARRPEWATDRQAEPRDTKRVAEPEPVRATAQVLEDNVRELLHRLQSDLKAKSPRVEGLATPAIPEPHRVAPAGPSPKGVSGDLEAALAIWAGKKAPMRR